MPPVVFDRETWLARGTICDTLVTAPPGCGKTELLARRAAGLVRDGTVQLPRQILAVTFTRKATSNLLERLHRYLGPRASRHVCVTNFHRLGFRLARAHGPLVGHFPQHQPLNEGITPNRIRKEVAQSHDVRLDEIDTRIREAKCGAFSNEEVMDRLDATGEWAVEYERRLRDAGCLDFNDAIRIGSLLLRHPVIAKIYRQRFPVMLVDEAQDLSEAYLDMIDGIGIGRTVFAGDRAQGIYGFAGATPDAVYERIEKRASAAVQLDFSYRSAPAILSVVNWSSNLLGGGALTTAPEMDWTTAVTVQVQEFRRAEEEAVWVLEKVTSWQANDPDCSIAVIVRTGIRRRFIDARVEYVGMLAQRWDEPSHKPHLVSRLRRFGRSIIATHGDGLEALKALGRSCIEDVPDNDQETVVEIFDAIESLTEAVTSEGLESALAKIRTEQDPNLPAPAGLHLLNGHLGKGQQFDKVVVVGLEDDSIPSYHAKSAEALKDELAVLHVMTSRARDALVFTRSSDVPNPRTGRSWYRRESRWLNELRALTTD